MVEELSEMANKHGTWSQIPKLQAMEQRPSIGFLSHTQQSVEVKGAHLRAQFCGVQLPSVIRLVSPSVWSQFAMCKPHLDLSWFRLVAAHTVHVLYASCAHDPDTAGWSQPPACAADFGG